MTLDRTPARYLRLDPIGLEGELRSLGHRINPTGGSFRCHARNNEHGLE
jgi:hypothetical protein